MMAATEPLTGRIHDLAHRVKGMEFATTVERDTICEMADLLDELAVQCEVTARLQARTIEQLQAHLDGKDWRDER